MDCILGIDLGTSSVKAMLLDAREGVIGVEAQGYDVSVPRAGYAEQSPHEWWDGVCRILAALRNKYPAAFSNIRSIGLSGQMHGLVMVDGKGAPLSGAILWPDQRSETECVRIRERARAEGWDAVLKNRVMPGYAFPSLLWVREHRNDLYNNTAKIMQPKDYLRFRLTGETGAEVTDASSTLMFDVSRRDWAFQVTDAFGIRRDIFPECHESLEVAGCVTAAAQEETGLSAGIPVIYGAGDQQCQSIGNGVYGEGTVICNIGTGGQISVFSETDRYDRQLRTNTFCHCTGGAYTVYGAVLSAGMALKWLKDNILHGESYESLSRKAAGTARGSEGLWFLPYLAGERTPHMNPAAKGMFFGLQLCHTEKHLARAVMEGVTYALCDSLDILTEQGAECGQITASGGAANSPVWLQMQADIFNRAVKVCAVREQACLGACILAGVGTGMFKNLREACERFVRYEEAVYLPDSGAVREYAAYRGIFRALYEKNRELFLSPGV